MKQLCLFIFISFFITACSKPTLLKSDLISINSDICIKLSGETQGLQNIYEITGWENETHNFDVVYHFYYLDEFILPECSTSSNQVIIKNAKVGAIYASAGKGKFYLKLIIDLEISFVSADSAIINQQLLSEVSTNVMVIPINTNEKIKVVSRALTKGYQSIIHQIKAELNLSEITESNNSH